MSNESNFLSPCRYIRQCEFTTVSKIVSLLKKMDWGFWVAHHNDTPRLLWPMTCKYCTVTTVVLCRTWCKAKGKKEVCPWNKSGESVSQPFLIFHLVWHKWNNCGNINLQEEINLHNILLLKINAIWLEKNQNVS